MSTSRLVATVAASLVLALTVAVPASAAEDAAVTPDGLELVKKSRLDILYRRPGVDFAGYSKMMLDPVDVAFKKQWARDFKQVSNSDREQIRSELAKEFQKVFFEELEEKGGYKIVSAPGPDVLRVSAAVVELYINAPDIPTSGRSNTYALSTGEATLIAELRDSESGSVIGRVTDRQRARESATMQWITSARNRADARVIMRKWAGALREGLDEARGVPK